MSDETINTNSFELNPSGHYVIDVDELNKKVRTSKRGQDFILYELKGQIVDCDFTPETNNFKISMFPNAMVDVLRALGAKETKPGLFARPENNEIAGKRIEFELIHVEDKSGQMRESLIEVKAVKDEDRKKMPAEKTSAWDDNA